MEWPVAPTQGGGSTFKKTQENPTLPWNPVLGSFGFYWVLLGFIGFYWVLRIGYWVLRIGYF